MTEETKTSMDKLLEQVSAMGDTTYKDCEVIILNAMRNRKLNEVKFKGINYFINFERTLAALKYTENYRMNHWGLKLTSAELELWNYCLTRWKNMKCVNKPREMTKDAKIKMFERKTK